MALSPVMAAPPQYAAQTPRPDLMQSAGTFALAAAAPEMMAQEQPVIDQAFHGQLVEDFEAAEDASRANREKAERDHDYYHGKQWAEKDVEKLRKRGQPAISLNMIRAKIDFLQGLERTQRTMPRALPRTRMHEEDAQDVGDALKFVVQDNRYDRTRSKTWEDLLLVGWGGTELSVQEVPPSAPGEPTLRIVLKRCAWDRMFWDPFTSEDDFADAAYRGLVVWMDRTEAVRTYGDDAGKVFDETVSSAQVGGTFDDKPKLTTWVQAGKRQRVRIVQMYRISDGGEWQFWEFTKGGILKGGPSPWLDAQRKRTHPYDWATAFIDRDNNRYGVVRDLIDPQDEINKRRSKALHHFTVRQTFGTPRANALQSAQERRKQLAMPDGHVEMPDDAKWGVDFGVIQTNDQSAGHFELLQQVMGAFETMGPNAAAMGNKSSALSGRSVLAQQQGGIVQQGTLTDTLKDLDYRTYHRTWNAIRQFWTSETWIRVTDDERNLRWVGLNSPKMMQVQGTDGQVHEMPDIDPMTGQPRIQNAVAEVSVDIIIDDAPEVGSMLDEQFGILVKLKQFDGNNEIPFKALIAAAPGLRDKAKILEAMAEREQAPADPMKMQAAQLQLADGKAGVAVKETQAELNDAKAASIKINAAHSHASALVGAMRGGLPPDQELQPPPMAV